jgi:CheY-like chemotaxis protein
MAKKLLLADDSQTIQKVVELVLGPEGFLIEAHGNGQEALNALETLMPDLILADIEMPGLNGYQLCEKVRSNPRTQHIPLILLAGAFEPFDEDYMKSVGADDCIIKPFESHELLSKVKSLLVQTETAEPVQVISAPVETTPAGQNEGFEPHHFAVASDPKTGAKDFEEELRDSIRILEKEWKEEAAFAPELKPEPEAMSIEEISRMVKEAVGGPADRHAGKSPVESLAPKEVPVIDAVKVEDIVRDSVQYLAQSMKPVIDEAVRKQIAGIMPGLLEEALKKNLMEISGPLKDLINAEIKKVVPELAERIIRREIDKITSELA